MSERPVLSVSALTRRVKDLVEANFPYVWVVGEISNCTRARSGHVYLTLKDESAQLRAVLWRRTASRLKFDLEDGLEVMASGPLEIYQPRGTYQLIVEEMVPQGVGALELAFRQLREKLEAEGLFALDHKRPLPRFPRRIALVTSPTGAAVRDLLQVMTRRWPRADIVLLPVAVQGKGAAQQIAEALRTVPRIPDVDLIITGRGGGSLEDLWAFNEEIVARAVYDSPIPVISAVGHEIDVSIADLVADRRALTPSEAGELAVPLYSDVVRDLHGMRDRLCAALRDRAGQARMQLDSLATRRVFTRPKERLHDRTARLDELADRLQRGIRRRMEAAQRDVAGVAASLDALSPLKVLRRGYTVTTRTDDGKVVREAARLASGQKISTLFEKGKVVSTVDTVEPDAGPSKDVPEVLPRQDGEKSGNSADA